uniref:Uncharacterized protein n=1 Tax=Octopus bimaculoides TaxID=37653 RepID=A0A0L8FSX7_OCTBM
MEDAFGRNWDRSVHPQTRAGELLHRLSCFPDPSGEEEPVAKSIFKKMEGCRKKVVYARGHASAIGQGIEGKDCFSSFLTSSRQYCSQLNLSFDSSVLQAFFFFLLLLLLLLLLFYIFRFRIYVL